MNEKIEELKKDIAEIENFQALATRMKVKDILSIEARKLKSELIKLQEENVQSFTPTPATPATSANKHYEIKLNNYAWDQTSKFVKFYVTLPKIQSIPQENISCKFTNKSLELTVKNLENKDYSFIINNLLNAINPGGSNWKVKTDLVVINASKVKDETWSHVTELEKKSVDSKKLKTDEKLENMDPSESLMSLMKNMYETGDDEMKRTIAKAWTESQAKKSEL